MPRTFMRLRRAGAGRRGTSAVEFALCFPMMVLLVGGVLQFGLVLFAQNTMLDAARDVSRRVAVGDMTSDGAESWLQGRLPRWIPDARIEIVPATEVDPQVTVSITVPMAKVAIVDPLNLFGGKTLQISVVGTAR